MATGTFSYNAIETDKGTTSPFTNNSVATTIVVSVKQFTDSIDQRNKHSA